MKNLSDGEMKQVSGCIKNNQTKYKKIKFELNVFQKNKKISKYSISTVFIPSA